MPRCLSSRLGPHFIIKSDRRILSVRNIVTAHGKGMCACEVTGTVQQPIPSPPAATVLIALSYSRTLTSPISEPVCPPQARTNVSMRATLRCHAADCWHQHDRNTGLFRDHTVPRDAQLIEVGGSPIFSCVLASFGDLRSCSSSFVNSARVMLG